MPTFVVGGKDSRDSTMDDGYDDERVGWEHAWCLAIWAIWMPGQRRLLGKENRDYAEGLGRSSGLVQHDYALFSSGVMSTKRER